MERRTEVTSKLAIEQVFPGDSEMAALMRATDWAQTPLGPIETWSPILRTMAPFLLANRFPLLLWWGPQFCQLYNDPYRPVLGTKHPRSMGQPASACWPEIWNVIGPLIETPFNGGPATWSDDLFLELNRHGFVEETHFTIAYSPVPDETAPSGIGGVLATVYEISEKVVAERRVELLRDLGARSAEAKTAEEACQIAAEALGHYPKDIPFALLYLADSASKQARLAASAGIGMGTPASPLSIELGSGPSAEASGGQVWPLAGVVRTEAIHVIENLAGQFDPVPPGPWSDPPDRAVVVPIRSNVAHQLAGFLVAGVSARLRLDDTYAGFYELVSGQIATAIANARAYEEERRRAEALAEIDRAKTIFFSNVSHEFRTPLTLMLGPLADLLDAPDGADGLPAQAREELVIARRNGQRLLKLVNTLLDFSRIEAGRVQASYVPTDLAGFTTDLASSFRSLCEKAGLHLVTDCPALPEPVYVDRDMWEKIVLNLLSNAFKFTFTGGITVALRQLPGTDAPTEAREEAMVELLVRDTGIGIPAEEVPRLFERFHRVEGVRGRTYEGSGIGLALVRELVHLHGGSITVASTPGEGTTFRITVPLGTDHLPADRIGSHISLASTAIGAATYVEEAERWLPDGASKEGLEYVARPVAAEVADLRAIPARVAGAHIVLADDNADMREYLGRLLGERYHVEAVANGARALAAIARELPDLVLADVMMPDMDGFALLERIRGNPRTASLPVILLSARAGEEATLEGLARGADDYLIKPFSARELLSRVSARLEMARLRQEALARVRELETTFESMTDAVFIYDCAGYIVRTNAAARTLFGLDEHPDYETRSPQERRNVVQACDEQGRPLPVEESALYRLLRGDVLTGANALDVRLHLAGGRELQVNISGAPLRDETGAIVGAIAVSRDMTERRQLERRTHEALEALLAMAEAIVAVPGDERNAEASERGRIVHRVLALVQGVFAGQYVGAALLDLDGDAIDPLAVVGLTPAITAQWWRDMRANPLSRHLPPPLLERLRAEEVLELDLSGQPPIAHQDYLRVQRVLTVAQHLADGRFCVMTVEVRDRPLFTSQERDLVRAAVRLVALAVEREQLTREREEAQAREFAAVEARRQMDEFLSIASHELRTPLTSVMANVQMAVKAAEALRDTPVSEALANRLERQRLLLERTDRQLKRLDRLVGDLLDVSRISSGKLDLRAERCDLVSIVRDVVEAQRAAWPGRRITLAAPRNGPVSLIADPDRIGQVVTNYLTNALKYSADDQPVEVSVRLRHGVVRVAIRDAGSGLTEEQQALLFEQFSRVPGIEQQSGSGVGLGLGLYICKTIVERHGGLVGVESAPGAGSTFWFTLPVRSADEQAEEG